MATKMAAHLMLVLAMALLGLTMGYTRFSSSYQAPLYGTCPNGYALGCITSSYSSSYKDRTYSFRCNVNVMAHRSCNWYSSYVYYGSYGYEYRQCPSNYVLAGVSSTYNAFGTYKGERTWQFRCCSTSMMPRSCSWTSYINSWCNSFHYNVPMGQVIAGMKGYKSSSYKGERRWKLYLCMIRGD